MLVILLWACTVPPSCDAMCQTSAKVWAECVETYPLGWDSTPFDGRADHARWCDTWIWEQRQLKDDLAATCSAEKQRVAAASCEELL